MNFSSVAHICSKNGRNQRISWVSLLIKSFKETIGVSSRDLFWGMSSQIFCNRNFPSIILEILIVQFHRLFQYVYFFIFHKTPELTRGYTIQLRVISFGIWYIDDTLSSDFTACSDVSIDWTKVPLLVAIVFIHDTLISLTEDSFEPKDNVHEDITNKIILIKTTFFIEILIKKICFILYKKFWFFQENDILPASYRLR